MLFQDNPDEFRVIFAQDTFHHRAQHVHDQRRRLRSPPAIRFSVRNRFRAAIVGRLQPLLHPARGESRRRHTMNTSPMSRRERGQGRVLCYLGERWEISGDFASGTRPGILRDARALVGGSTSRCRDEMLLTQDRDGVVSCNCISIRTEG